MPRKGTNYDWVQFSIHGCYEVIIDTYLGCDVVLLLLCVPKVPLLDTVYSFFSLVLIFLNVNIFYIEYNFGHTHYHFYFLFTSIIICFIWGNVRLVSRDINFTDFVRHSIIVKSISRVPATVPMGSQLLIILFSAFLQSLYHSLLVFPAFAAYIRVAHR